jgi:hypothetical protein
LILSKSQTSKTAGAASSSKQSSEGVNTKNVVKCQASNQSHESTAGQKRPRANLSESSVESDGDESDEDDLSDESSSELTSSEDDEDSDESDEEDNPPPKRPKAPPSSAARSSQLLNCDSESEEQSSNSSTALVLSTPQVRETFSNDSVAASMCGLENALSLDQTASAFPASSARLAKEACRRFRDDRKATPECARLLAEAIRVAADQTTVDAEVASIRSVVSELENVWKSVFPELKRLKEITEKQARESAETSRAVADLFSASQGLIRSANSALYRRR